VLIAYQLTKCVDELVGHFASLRLYAWINSSYNSIRLKVLMPITDPMFDLDGQPDWAGFDFDSMVRELNILGGFQWCIG
jgi:hypothetical protein